MTTQDKFRGVGVALITPFKEDGSVDYNGLKRLLDHCFSGSVDYLLINGTTSEASTIEPEEKLEILSFIVKNNTKKLPIMYGIGANNTNHVLQLIDKTPFEYIDAVLTVTPYYNKPSQEGLFQHYTQVADKSPVPVLLYNVPGRTGVNLNSETTIRLSKHTNIFGIKEASGNIEQALSIVKGAQKGFMLISGDDMLTVPLISIGAQGVISVLANAYPEKFSDLIHNALNGSFVQATNSLVDFIAINGLLYAESNPVGIKEVLKYKGVCGNQCRLPLIPASKGLSKSIQEAMI